MISACESHEYIPHGRAVCGHHPGPRSSPAGKQSRNEQQGAALLKSIQDISIADTCKSDWWQLRRSAEAEGCDEELYVSEHTAVWSTISREGNGHIIKSFTLDGVISQALWCTFLIPWGLTPKQTPQQSTPAVALGARQEKGVCLIQTNIINIFTADGRDYETALPFQVAKAWPIANGLLFERAIPESYKDSIRTPCKETKQLPVLFSMSHPLDEVAPVICRTGGPSSSGKVSFVTENSQCLVFSSEDPSLVMTYDSLLSVHSLWTVRLARVEEAYSASHGDLVDPFHQDATTPGISQSGSVFSKLSLSTQSPSLSPFRSYGSRINSPSGAGNSRPSSPSLSHIAVLSRSHSPSLHSSSLYRLQTPSPPFRSSPINMARTPLSMNATCATEQSFRDGPQGDLMPEICLDHLWTESAAIPRDGCIGRATSVFLSSDLCGQQFLCYLVAFRHSLRCVRFEESNDGGHLIVCAATTIPARDAAPLKALNLLLVLDLSYHLVLYSGTSKMSQVYVAGLPTPLTMSGSVSACLRPSTPFSVSGGPVTSSRPPSAMDARFDEEVELSPVRTEPDSSQILDGSLADDISFAGPPPATGVIAALRDAVGSRVTLELVDGTLHRTSMPKMTSSPIVTLCLDALKQVLPRTVALNVLIKWYCTHNSPGSTNGQSEWTQFSMCLLSMMGYDVTKLSLTQQVDGDSSLSPVVAPKKAKPSDAGGDKDWAFLLTSCHHQYIYSTQNHLLGLEDTPVAMTTTPQEPANAVDAAAPLFPHIPAAMFAIHLVYEELKLSQLYTQELQAVATLLCQMACDLQLVLYMSHYARDHPKLMRFHKEQSLITSASRGQLQQPAFISEAPPSIFQWLQSLLRGQINRPFPFLHGVSNNTKAIVVLYVSLLTASDDIQKNQWHKYLRGVSAVARRAWNAENPLDCPLDLENWSNQYERAVLCMVKLGLRAENDLVFGVSLPLKEAISHCQQSPPSNWSKEAYALIGREDLARQSACLTGTSPGSHCKDMAPSTKAGKEEEDGMEYMDQKLLKLRYSDDLRVQEVRRLLQSSRPVKISLTQKPEVSDHEFIEEQERHLYAICIRTMALPAGRGMFTLCTYHPVPTETLPIPKLCLTGRAPPRNTSVDLSHIDTPPNMAAWPHFHNGVAAGLRIASSTQVNSTWIIYNKPRSTELTNEHAGFLMGLGLNGHLSELEKLCVHDYLIKVHDMTSIGLLLGVAAGKRGTMDVQTTRLLSIHVPALLPPTSTELDIAHNIQVAAVLGVGLVYQGTAHCHIAEVLLGEIGRPPGPEMENCMDRESYSLAAGLSLGMVMLQQGGKEMGLSDLSMADQLYHYMVGGHKRPLTGVNRERYKSPSYQIKEGDAVNVDVTAPGATLALGMMFFKTANTAVAEWMNAPDTQFLLDFVRPDFLMLRTIAHGLIMWDEIFPSEDWIRSNLPEIVSKYAFNKSQFRDTPNLDIDFETMSQAFCNIVAGACMAMGLKFAGSANQPAYRCLLSQVRHILDLMAKPSVVEQAGRSTVENCLVVVVLSVAMVMSGTGDLEVLRLCRHLRTRVGPQYNYVLYGSHMAVNMALGLLFMGGGRYSLNTHPESIAVMLCAFFPKFPIHSNDNRYHLQAFRHLYVLASEARVILPRDVDTGQACYVPLKVTFKDTDDYKDKSYECLAPWVLPQLSLIRQIEIVGPRYWPIKFNKENWATLELLLRGSGYLYVKQRAGHLPYKDDPKGYHSVLSQSLTSDQSLGKVFKSDNIKSFSSDARILAFAECFCHVKLEEEYGPAQFLSHVLYECVSQEKPEVLSVHFAIEQTVQWLCSRWQPLSLWQIKLLMAYYRPRLAPLTPPVSDTPAPGPGPGLRPGGDNLDSPLLWQHRSKLHIPAELKPDTSMLDKSNNPPKTDVQSAKQLIGMEMLEAATSRVQGHLHQWQTEHSIALVKYLSGEEVSPSDYGPLACLLTWHDLPHPAQFSRLQYEGMPTFIELYSLLKPFGLSVSAVMLVLSALQEHQTS